MLFIKVIILLFLMAVMPMNSSPLDSLENKLKNSKGINRIDPLHALASKLWNVESKKALSYSKEALMHSLKNHDTLKIATSHAYIGMCYEYLTKYDSSLYHYHISLDLFKSVNDTVGTIRQYINIGLTNYAKGNYGKTIDAYNHGLDLAVKFGAKSAEASLLNNIAMVYQSLKDHEKALEFYQKTYDIHVKANDTAKIARTLSNIGSVYSDIDENDKALTYNQNALQYFERVGYERGISKSLNNIGINYISLGKYDEAISVFNRSLEIKEKRNDVKGFINTYFNFAVLYSKKGNSNLAFEYLNKSKKLIEDNGFTDFASEMPYHFYKVNKNLGNYQAALDYYIISEKILDSIGKSESNQKLNQLGLKYESLARQKENEILKQENKIKHLELRKEVSTNHILLTFLILFIAGIVYVIYLYWQKRRTAILLDIKNQELEEINKKLVDSEEQLKTLSITKDKLYSVIAHDLMNPITVFISLSDYLISYSKDLSKDDFEESLVDINSSAKGLMHLLKNMLQWARHQSGLMVAKLNEYDINELILDNIRLYSSDLNFKKLIVNHNLNSILPAVFDVNMINTVVRNFISNAIKFSYEGSHINIESKANNGSVVVSISDSGVGIDEEHMNKLFKFEEAYSTSGTNHEIGTGLGLLICKEFVELCHGKIWVESTPNEGTTFSFSVPVK